jgi:hypothetical protein
VQPAGSGRNLRLDPLSLPVCFEARDMRADGGFRHIEINRERVLVRRAVHGMRMTLQVRIREFLGIVCRQTEEGQALVLAHRDPSLSVPLLVSADGDEIEQAWSLWSDLFALPQIDEENDLVREPALRRRRHSAIRARRPKFLVRRRAGYVAQDTPVHRDEREIIARH